MLNWQGLDDDLVIHRFDELMSSLCRLDQDRENNLFSQPRSSGTELLAFHKHQDFPEVGAHTKRAKQHSPSSITCVYEAGGDQNTTVKITASKSIPYSACRLLVHFQVNLAGCDETICRSEALAVTESLRTDASVQSKSLGAFI